MKDAGLTLLFAVYELLEEVLSHALYSGEVRRAVDRQEVEALLLGPKLSGEGSGVDHDLFIALTNQVLLLACVHIY